MKTSFKKAVEFSRAARMCLTDHPTEDKLTYAINKVLKQLSPIDQKFADKKEDIDLDHANTDEKGSTLFKIVSGPSGEYKQYEFTPANTKLVRDKQRDLLVAEIFEYEPYYAARVPEDLNPELIPFLTGFVIEESIPFEEVE